VSRRDTKVERGGGGRDECKAGQREFELAASANPEADPRGALYAAAGSKGVYPEGGWFKASNRDSGGNRSGDPRGDGEGSE
jgi:hypothetical protein